MIFGVFSKHWGILVYFFTVALYSKLMVHTVANRFSGILGESKCEREGVGRGPFERIDRKVDNL